MKTADTTSKRARRGAVLASGLACAALLLGGCAAEPREAADAAIVIQNTQNVPTWDDTVLDEAIAQVRSSGGRVTVTIADSNPTSQTFDFGEVADSALNQDRLERKLRDALRQGADDPGVDLLKSIEVGATSIAGSSNVVGVYVVSSGIADTGLLNMAGSNLVEADADAVAEYYAAKNELPDLSWVRVVTWYGMGATADGQAAPSTAQKASMEALYQAVLEKCGTGLSVQNASVRAPNRAAAACLPWAWWSSRPRSRTLPQAAPMQTPPPSSAPPSWASWETGWNSWIPPKPQRHSAALPSS